MRHVEPRALAGWSVVLLSSCLPVPGCISLDPTEDERRAAIRYADATPFVLGEGAESTGEDDLLERYREYPAFGGLLLVSGVRVEPAPDGTERAVPVSSRVVLLAKAGLDAGLRERVRVDLCDTPETCEAPIELTASKYSLRELRSLVSWVARSPIGAYVEASVPVFEDAGAFTSEVVFAARPITLALLDRMLKIAMVPEDLYRLTTTRPSGTL
ncbi:MAG: hypothetical protein MUC96_15470 [Myxococcaceae bacterium]|jgi:hypothetical protein|nr:hypothetical protein [Myxococcaceae bacterium]